MEKKPPRWSAEEVPTAAVAQGGGGVAGVGFERGGPGGGEDPSEGLVAICCARCLSQGGCRQRRGGRRPTLFWRCLQGRFARDEGRVERARDEDRRGGGA